MRCTRFRPVLLLSVAAFGLSGPEVRAGGLPYTIDILSSDFYPALQDAWMMRINNQGVAAGYIATDSPYGPYQATTYAGGGRFQPLGIESLSYGNIVAGINDRGDVAGTLLGPSGVSTYVDQDGTISYPSLPANLVGSSFLGINNADLVYGRGFDPSTFLSQVFTVTNGQATVLPLSAPGLTSFATDAGLLSDKGLLGVTGFSQDGSISRAMVYDTRSGALTPLVAPGGYATVALSQITGSGLIVGIASTVDGSSSRMGFWNADGSFRGFVDTPDGISDVRFNDLGQAIGLGNNGQALLYDGSSWSGLTIQGLGGYSLAEIDDFNDRGQFVGLANSPDGSWSWGFVATSVPEPSACVLLATGVIVLVAFARRRGFPS